MTVTHSSRAHSIAIRGGNDYEPASNITGYPPDQPSDFSMGVTGIAIASVPEPSTLVLGLIGTLTALVTRCTAGGSAWPDDGIGCRRKCTLLIKCDARSRGGSGGRSWFARCSRMVSSLTLRVNMLDSARW